MLNTDFVQREELKDTFKDLYEERNDMQGLITRGYRSLWAASYLLLKITEAQAAKEYFKLLVNNYVTTVGSIKDFKEHGDPEEAVQIAFTSSGLTNLKLDDNVIKTFSREFIEGIG